MKKQSNLLVIVVLAIVSTVLTLFAPLAKESADSLLGSYSNNICLFDGSCSDICVALAVISGICFILFSALALFGNTSSGLEKSRRISGIALLAMQIICIIQARNPYDSDTLFGSLYSEFSDISIHPIVIVTILTTAAGIYLSFKNKLHKEDDNTAN